MAGLALVPLPVVIGLTSRLMGQTTERIGPRLPLAIGPVVTGFGFALLSLVDPGASYWTGMLPALLIIALGMAGAVAPLTTAVLGSVDSRHTGTASGLNSAIARAGGLFVTALTGAVFGEAGAGLLSAFHSAALVGAGLAAGAGVIAFASLSDRPPRAPGE